MYDAHVPTYITYKLIYGDIYIHRIYTCNVKKHHTEMKLISTHPGHGKSVSAVVVVVFQYIFPLASSFYFLKNHLRNAGVNGLCEIKLAFRYLWSVSKNIPR